MNNLQKNNIIKLIGVDLDGTLLYKNKHNKFVSKESIYVLNEFIKKNGGKIVILTGRAMVSTRKIVDYVNQFLIEPIRYVACFNGALVYDLKEKKILFQDKLSEDITSKIFEICKNNKAIFWMYPTILPKKDCYVIVNWFYITRIMSFFKNDHVLYTKFLKNTDAHKIVVIEKNLKKINKLYHIIHSAFSDLELAYTSKFSFEITPKGVNKGSAIKVILKNMENISLDEVAAIGDSGNDKSMFEIVKTSLAMPGAPDYLKNIATFVGNKSKKKLEFAELFSKIINKDQ